MRARVTSLPSALPPGSAVSRLRRVFTSVTPAGAPQVRSFGVGQNVKLPGCGPSRPPSASPPLSTPDASPPALAAGQRSGSPMSTPSARPTRRSTTTSSRRTPRCERELVSAPPPPRTTTPPPRPRPQPRPPGPPQVPPERPPHHAGAEYADQARAGEVAAEHVRPGGRRLCPRTALASASPAPRGALPRLLWPLAPSFFTLIPTNPPAPRTSPPAAATAISLMWSWRSRRGSSTRSSRTCREGGTRRWRPCSSSTLCVPTAGARGFGRLVACTRGEGSGGPGAARGARGGAA